MRKLAILLAAVLTLNLAAPAAPVYAVAQDAVTETEVTVNEEEQSEEGETVEAQTEEVSDLAEDESVQDEEPASEETAGCETSETETQTEQPLREETTEEVPASVENVETTEETAEETAEEILAETMGESQTVDDRELTVKKVETVLNEVRMTISLTGNAAEGTNYILLYYRQKNSQEWTRTYTIVYEAEETRLSFSGLKDNTEYEYVIGLGKEYNTPKDELIKTTTGEFKTMEDDRKLVVEKTEPGSDCLKVSYKITGKAAEDIYNDLVMYYRLKDSEDTWSVTCDWSYGEGGKSGSLGVLKENTEYEYVLGLGINSNTPKDELKDVITGVFKTQGDDKKFVVSKTEPGRNFLKVSYEITGKAAEGVNNYLVMYYRLKDSEDRWSSTYVSSYGVGNMQRTFYVPKENTEYEYVLGIGKAYNTPKDELTNVTTGEFKTLSDDRDLIVEKVVAGAKDVDICYELTGKAAEGESNNYIVVYYRLKGSEGKWKNRSVLKYGAGKGTLTCSGLEKESEYEYVIGLGKASDTSKDELTKATTGEFTTIADDRTLQVRDDPGMHSALFEVEISGKAAIVAKNDTYIFWREKGSEEWHSEYNYMYGRGTLTISLDDNLKEATEYEYVVGLADGSVESKDDLIKTVTGTFKTLEDTRKLENVTCEVGYASAQIYAKIVNNINENYMYVYYFLREKGTDAWTRYSSYGGWNTVINTSYRINSLKMGTEYEYVVCANDGSELSSPDDMEKEKLKVSGSFTTKSVNYKIDIAPKDSKCTQSKAYVDIKVSGDVRDEQLDTTLYVTDGLNELSKKVSLTQSQGYKNTVMFTGLKSGTEYRVTKATIAVRDIDGSMVNFEVSEFDEDITFTTKAPIVPATIKLPVDELYLNAAGGGDYISGQMLNASVTPADASKDFIWSSDNEEVAIVRDGYVSAVGSGSANITVSSAHNPEVTAVCKVFVKNYVVARENAAGVPERIYGQIGLCKGECLEGFALYEVGTDGELSKVDGMSVSVEKSLVAQWSGDKLKAIGAGTSKVYFEANGIKAVLNILVNGKSIGFGLVGLETADGAYPAVCTENGVYTIANKEGLTYTVIGEITPQTYFDANAFVWTSSDESIAAVNNGVITPLAEGRVTITAVPAVEPSPYVQSEASIALDIKEVPSQGEEIPYVYALTNTKAKMLLEDVAFPAEWGEGWSWTDPKTPLYSLPVHQDAYAFEAVYSGDDMYPYEGFVNVYISQVKDVYAYEEFGNHNQVIEAGEEDSIVLRIASEHMGLVPSNYRYVFPDVEGLTITKTDDIGGYQITAQKDGKYTLIPTMEFFETNENGEEEVICRVSGKEYTIKAIKKAQAAAIILTCADENAKISNSENGSVLSLDFTDAMKGKEITLSAEVEDKNGNKLDTTGLKWTISDKTVATVSYKKNASHTAVITVKGSGHAMLSVTASDDTAYTQKLGVEIRDYKPRINTSKATVNIAYDYSPSNYGRTLAADNYGIIEIYQAYDNEIENVRLLKKNGEEEPDLKLSLYNGDNYGNLQYIVMPVRDEIPVKIYDCMIEVVTSRSAEPYRYSMKVKVVDESVKVTAKMGTTMNLFYTYTSSDVYFNVKGAHFGIRSVQWEDKATDAMGFTVDSSGYWNSSMQCYTSSIYQYKVQVVNGKPIDAKIATGTFTVSLYGFREPVEIKNFKVKYNYKKPTLEARSATTSVAPSVGSNTASFYVYNKTDKNYIYYYPGTNTTEKSYYYDLSYDNDYVEATANYGKSYINTIYQGHKAKETVTYTLTSYGWREPLKVKQTIKKVTPKASLTPSTITYNKGYKSAVSTYVYVGNVSSFAVPSWMDVEVKGADAKAKALVDKGIFDITISKDTDSPVMIALNQTSLMDLEVASKLKAGTYKFKVTPYYRNQDTGKKMKLNTLNLSVKVVDKPVTVKVTPKGSLDIVKVNGDLYTMRMNAQFKNLGQDYLVIGAKLKGEYSKYFKLQRKNESNHLPSEPYYLQLDRIGKIKAGQEYKLSIEYTLKAPNGDTFTVNSNVFKVKPKQSAPKATVYLENNVFYAASELIRYCEVYIQGDYYQIESVSGSLDCNKDGKADIALYDIYTGVNYFKFNIAICDKDAVTATKAGKTYTIPVTVTLKGRDGISKDAKVNIKVKVKR